MKLTSGSGPGDPFPSHSGGAEWKHKHNSGGDPSVSNGTKIKERQAHHEYVYLWNPPMRPSKAHVKQEAKQHTQRTSGVLRTEAS